MAASPVAVQTAPATKGSAKDDARLLDKLVKLWASYTVRSLEVRQEIGSLLNERLGPPTQRQRRGRFVLTHAAQSLQIAVSELNRMRWFAHLSKDEQSCWGDTPMDKRSWTKFKKRLPNLIAAVKRNEKPSGDSGEKKVSAVVNGVLRSIHSVTSQLRAGDFHVAGAKRDKLIEELQELGSAVFTSVGVRFRLEAEDEALAVA